MKNDKGIVYVAFGHLYLIMALFSINTLRRKKSKIPVIVITNLHFNYEKLEFWSQELDHVKFIDVNTTLNREIKTNLYKHVPFNQVAYIDADTYILNDLGHIWTFFDYFDVALKLNPTRQSKIGKGDQLILNSRTFVRDLPHFNSGVIFFKKSDKTKNFFSTWYKYFKKGGITYDQVSLIEAIFKTDVRILPLTADWNYFPDWKYFIGKVKTPFIVHYTNRISYSLETELLKIAKKLGFDQNQILKQIYLKRMARRNKIGLIRWLILILCWKFFSRYEEKKWN